MITSSFSCCFMLKIIKFPNRIYTAVNRLKKQNSLNKCHHKLQALDGYFECSFRKQGNLGKGIILSMNGMQFKMELRLIRKLEKAGATSLENAVTVLEAKLDEQEQDWIDYFAGSFLEKIKKTSNQTYYL